MTTPEWSMAFDVGSAAELQALAEQLAHQLAPGDLLVLSGELGAGKTTFTQGLGRGLAVEERIISPTFVLVRQHPSAVSGPGLIHVDAYRLESAAAVDDLDLEATLAANVTVIEWGAGRVEHLSDSHLLVDIIRPTGGGTGAGRAGEPAVLTTDFDDDGEDEVRGVTLAGVGPRWRGGPPALALD
ncbi:tRNA (adenosine(37)-N6)-threonylcarbamoyltransferase complex ATPase subunit type 1 TsaE [Arthrobacter bussei]|jgi:tRNA threonylcarbamoyladenosine biosynthesis protein TsaE|uniref:tRNA threonylcarbamoyladenosine biosynthesis protein TsaE n=1 Tax=Arthrobacter bussei TaxID=2594179 RepID=A0A7X1NMT6_9MICC|nr:tRNA (adenosine(37)-N6)-threonylcarbamoyltransferase complex ATPase subunit type 1 TsaE [Arthrobacter bussei]MPY09742.1 tRNA (adenosine(37)-N6)-threonylcarbamoyltransferase complex ATPase subunit type 1 TsaE [Arthrobacter bussei]